MKSLNTLSKTAKKTLITVAAFLVVMVNPIAAFASTSGGGGKFGQSLGLIDILQDIQDFLTGPIMTTIIVIAFIVGAVMLLVNRRGENQGAKKMAVSLVAGSLIFSAPSLVDLLFAGAVI